MELDILPNNNEEVKVIDSAWKAEGWKASHSVFCRRVDNVTCMCLIPKLHASSFLPYSKIARTT